jgi:type III pantothenate kinase
MLLVVDVGNTEIDLGLYGEKNLEARWRMSSRVPRTADEVWILLKLWCETSGFAVSNITGVVVSSVVPSWTSVFAELSRVRLSKDPLIVDADCDTGLTVLIDSPQTLGADRICNAVAGFARFGGPLVVIDFGTATTFDVISPKGEYLGGAITLGIYGLSQELHRIAAKLPKVDLAFPPDVVGRSTETCMQSGILWGTVCMLEGMVDRIIREKGWSRCEVVATGGIAPLIVGRSKAVQHTEPDLTLEGMRILYQRCGRG